MNSSKTMKNIYYPNQRYIIYALLFIVALSIQLGFMWIYDELNLVSELWYIFAFQLVAILFYLWMGLSDKFILHENHLEYVKFSKNFKFDFETHKFVFKAGITDMKNHGEFFGMRFLPSHSHFWIKPLTTDRKIEILESRHFEMYISRKNAYKFYKALYERLSKLDLEKNLEKIGS